MKTSIDVDLLRKSGALISLKGKDYVMYKGLLYVAHQHGLEELTVEMISYDPDTKEAVCMATCKGTRGLFIDVADASPQNVTRAMATCTLRMASTRAKARALRDYLGIGICSLCELPGDDTEPDGFDATTDQRLLSAAAQWGGVDHIRQFCAYHNYPAPHTWSEAKMLSFIGAVERGDIDLGVLG